MHIIVFTQFMNFCEKCKCYVRLFLIDLQLIETVSIICNLHIAHCTYFKTILIHIFPTKEYRYISYLTAELIAGRRLIAFAVEF